MTVEIKVWDLPLRLFHWLLALAVAAAIVTGEIGGNLIDWHGRIGVFIVGLLVFRIVWGFVGSTHARFAAFFPIPSRIAAYLQGRWQGQGHNPLGALAVFALLAVLGALVGTGLFANDDIAFNGPLSALIDKNLSDQLSGWHARIFNILVGLLVLHLAAISFYAKVKKKDFVIPMLTGRKVAAAGTAATAGGGALRFVIALAFAVAVGWSVGTGLLVQQLQPAPVAPANTAPAW